jgi:hypothetical protein
MDLRVYYQKLRKIEAEITEPFVVLVSRATPDGGKPGVMTDVPRELAARMVADERADLANPEQSALFREGVEKAWKAAQDAQAEKPVEVPIPSANPARPGKKQ